MLCYFVGEDGSTYRATLKYRPYFYLAYREGYEKEVRMYIDSKIKKYESA
jgi:DNA polymerase epsilon subunit 1